MKNNFNEDFSDINNKEIISLLGSLENNIHKDISTYNSNNNNINNNYNYNFNSEYLKKSKRKKRNRNDRDQITSQTTYDIGTSLSSIKKQLNNISINGKNPLKISRIKSGESPNNKSYFLSVKEKHQKSMSKNNLEYNREKSIWNNIIIEKKQISFSILKKTSEKYDIILKNKDLEKENDLLKENIKFLLSQIKKMKKIDGIKDSLTKKVNDNEIEKDTNKNVANNNNNKLNNVFDIINKYKKDIIALKQELIKLNKENKELKESIINNSINEIKEKQYPVNSMKVFQKKNILTSRQTKDSFNTLFNNNPPLNHRNKGVDLLPYRKKSFNKTFSKKDKFSTFNNERNTNNFNYKCKLKHYNEKYCFNTERNKKKVFSTINNNIKDENTIIIDSDFAGDEKDLRLINSITTKNKLNHNLHFSTINHNDTNRRNRCLRDSAQVITSNICKKDLYHKKQVSSNKSKTISIKNYFTKKNLFNESNYKEVKSQKKEYDKNMLKLKIQKLIKNDE